MVDRKLVYCHQCGTELRSREIEGRDRAWCPECDLVLFRNAVPSAGVVVYDGMEVLLIRRAAPPNAGVWAIPGGHPEFDEEPAVGAARELEEETGLRVDPADLTLETVVYSRYEADDGTPRHYYMITYVVERALTSGELNPASDASDAAFWAVDDVFGRPERTREVDRRRLRAMFDA